MTSRQEYVKVTRVQAVRFEPDSSNYHDILAFAGMDPRPEVTISASYRVNSMLSPHHFSGRLNTGDWLVKEGTHKPRVMTDAKFMAQYKAA